MGKRLLFDTNILIDVLGERKPYFEAAQIAWNLHVAGDIDGYVASVSLTNFFYIMRRATDKEQAWRGVETILATFAIVAVDSKILNYATKMRGRDFEDNVQIACADALQLDGIITRDKNGFKYAKVTILQPGMLLTSLGEKNE